MFRNKKQVIVIFHDLVMTTIAWQTGWWLRFNLEVPEYYLLMSLYTLPLVLLIQSLVYVRFKIHRGLWRFASLQDVWNIFRSAVFGALCVMLALFIWNRLEGIPRSILIQYPVFLILLLSGPRLVYRIWKEHSFNVRTVSGDKRVLIIGAGNAGEMLVRDMLRVGSHIPAGFIDDNPALRNAEIHGIRVLGTVEEISEVCNQYHVDILVIAVPSASSGQMQRIVAACEDTGCALRTLPKLQDMVSGQVTMNELREVSIEDLLGREKVELDWKIIQKGLHSKVVMVSGGGGSIGAELCLQISKLNPSAIVIFERSEFNLYNVQRKLAVTSPSIKLHTVLGDLCDQEKVNHVLGNFKPDIIFHSAAYKHVPILQAEVREAVKNNILATKILGDAAVRHKCDKFVFISTDKAVNPVNVLGSSKRVAEMYCEWMNQQSTTRFITVRFGNVLDSDGSVVPLFREQIKKGGPVTVTHPEITRFFMTIPEACQLIMQASAMGNGGEIYVLDMGNPVKIAYLAEQMIKLSGRVPDQDIQIIYTGLRPGEKLYEELFYENEGKDITDHPKILLARHSDCDWGFLSERINELEQMCQRFDEEKLRSLLKELVPVKEQDGNQRDNIIPINIRRT